MRLKIIIPAAILSVVIIIASGLIWYTNRPLPQVITDQPLFRGIIYTREIHRDPIPIIIHVVKVDLTTSGLRFLVTPPDDLDGYVYAARTTSEFLAAFNLQLAINGDFFEPWHERGPFDYYPHSGDGVNTYGLSVSQGQHLTNGYGGERSFDALYITMDNRLSFTPPLGELANVISGNTMLVVDGQALLLDEGGDYLITRHPRTAVALSRNRSTLLLFVVDGRQPNYSDGATIAELTAIILRYGGHNALNLDGGGSSALVITGAGGQPVTLNSPIHTRIPGRERPVANHLGIYIDES
jgi:hypothetical protein